MKEIGLKNIILGFFIVVGIIGVLVFAGVVNIGSQNESASGSVTVWGTISSSVMQKYIDQIETNNLTVVYERKDELRYEQDLVNALAAGTGPDVVIMPHAQVLRNKDKLFEIPYESFPRRDFVQTYIRESELLLSDFGVIGLPLSVDPLVMYYNKSLFNAAFIIDVPEFWEEFVLLPEKLISSNQNGRIIVGGASLGTYDNIKDAKGIIAALLLQSGQPLVGIEPVTGKFQSLLASAEYLAQTQQALEFYTSFSDANNQNYGWNEALPSARDLFVAGDLGIYFGRASELRDIRAKNPNLDFDVSIIPQIKNRTNKATFGYMNVVSVSKQTQNLQGAFAVMTSLASQNIAEPLSLEINNVPARFDSLSDDVEDPYQTLFYQSAIIADGWVDPDPTRTSDLFRTMIRNINADAFSVQQIIQRTHTDLTTILDETINTTISDRQLRDL